MELNTPKDMFKNAVSFVIFAVFATALLFVKVNSEPEAVLAIYVSFVTDYPLMVAGGVLLVVLVILFGDPEFSGFADS